MSNLAIKMTDSNAAQISFSADENGDHLTVCDSTNHIINITDGHFTRRIQRELFRLRTNDYNGNVAVKLGDGPRVNLDNSLWCDLADALFAFTLNIDVGNLIGLEAAA